MLEKLKKLEVGSFVTIDIEGLSVESKILFRNLIIDGYLIPTDLTKYGKDITRIQLGDIVLTECKYYVNMKITENSLRWL